MTNQQDREVPIEVTSRHQQVSEKTRAYAVERVQKLLRFNDRISRIQVILDEEHDEFLTEVIVHVQAGSTLVVKELAEGYRKSLDAVLQKLERQLIKDKEKRRNHKHEALGEASKDASQGSEDDSDQSFEEAVREDIER